MKTIWSSFFIYSEVQMSFTKYTSLKDFNEALFRENTY